MKKSLFIALALVLMANLSNAQTIYHCNNDPYVTLSPNMFRTLQAAHDAASAGDIIYVEPSYNSTSYGGLTCTKTLRIIGNGYDLTPNTSITQPWNKSESLLGGSNSTFTIIIRKTAPNTVFEGLNLSLSGADLLVEAQNVTFSRCKIYVASGSYFQLIRKNTGENASGAIITKCRLGGGGSGLYIYANGYDDFNATTCAYTPYQVQNVTISNNIGFGGVSVNTSTLPPYNFTIRQGGSCTPATAPVSVPHANNFTIINNVTYSTLGINSCQNCTVQSNIIDGVIQSQLFSTIVAGNNVCTSTCGFGSNNVQNILLSSIFLGAGQWNTTDEDFRLKVGSPAIGAGVGGVDAGAFGTNNPYRISGLAPIPQITSYSKNASSGVYTTTTPMTVTISVRGNN